VHVISGCPGGRRRRIAQPSPPTRRHHEAVHRKLTQTSSLHRVKWLPGQTTLACPATIFGFSWTSWAGLPVHVHAAELILHLRFISCGAPFSCTFNQDASRAHGPWMQVKSLVALDLSATFDFVVVHRHKSTSWPKSGSWASSSTRRWMCSSSNVRTHGTAG
jgi:hypothetical protein